MVMLNIINNFPNAQLIDMFPLNEPAQCMDLLF